MYRILHHLIPYLRAWYKLYPETGLGLVFPHPHKSPQGKILGWRMATSGDDFGLPDLLRELGCHVPQERQGRAGREPRERVWHTFRHTLTSCLIEAGAAGDAVSRILGHGGRGSGMAWMTLNYAHAKSLDYLARELALVSFAPPAAAGVVSIGEARRERA